MTMPDFEALKTNATTAAREVTKENLTSDKKTELEKCFVDEMKAWESAVIQIEAEATEAPTDPTKTTEATKQRAEFNTFKDALDEELKALLTAKEAVVEEEEKETKAEAADLLNSINTLNFDAYKDLSSTELLHNNTYIREIQKAILAV
jgi:hypothetical protein